ncbi:MAG TPA: GldG family protein [bacterium]|nr:GldG family protein [bacterium]HPS29158.1 GldG family protein [bacterium]
MNRKKREALISVVLVTAMILLVNIIASGLFYRIDFTKNGMYTVSDSTKKILSGLKDEVRVKFYVSEELPPKVLPIKRNVTDLLTEYERYGKGNFNLSVLYPEKDAEIEKDAQSAGIQKVQLNVIGQNKEELQAAYMGIALFYGSKMEVLPVVMSIDDLEFQLTSAILKLTKEKKDRIVFLNSQKNLPANMDPQMRAQLMAQMPPSHSIYEDTTAVGQALGEMYDVEEKRLSDGTYFDESVKVVVIHETTELSEWEKYALDQFIMKGGKVAVLQSGMAPTQQMMAVEKNFNYDDQLKKYGFELKKDFVFDMYSYSVMVPQGDMRYLTPYPLWIKISPEEISSELPDMIKNGTLAFTYSSSISTTPVDGVKFKSVVKTSGKSWSESGTVVIDPSNLRSPSESELKTLDLAVMGEGKFKSAFTKDTMHPSAKERSDTFIEKGTADSAILFIAAPEFILDRTIRNFESNAIFFINMIDYLTNSTELVNIRSRGQGYTFISPDISDNAKNVIKWTGTILVPVILIFFGIFRMIIRNRRSGRVS